MNEPKCSGNSKHRQTQKGGRPGPTEEADPLSQLERERAQKEEEEKERAESLDKNTGALGEQRVGKEARGSNSTSR